MILNGIDVFLASWRAAQLVTIPAAGFNGPIPGLSPSMAIPAPPGYGILQNPFNPQAKVVGSQRAPIGIVIGVIDPITGIADWTPYWGRFCKDPVSQLVRTGSAQEAWEAATI